MLSSLDDRIFVLQRVTAMLRVDERYKFGQVCRALRRFIHSKSMELRAMEETLRIGLTHVDPCGYHWGLIEEMDMCKSIQTWHHMGARMIFTYLREVNRVSKLTHGNVLPVSQALLIIQVAQMSTAPQTEILITPIDDLGDVGTPREWEVAQVDEEEKTPGNPVHEVFFLIRDLLSDSVWYDRFGTPFNEWTPPLLYLWALFPEGVKRPSHIKVPLPKPPNHYVDKRVLTLPYKSIRVEDKSEGKRIFLSRHVVLMASRRWVAQAFSAHLGVSPDIYEKLSGDLKEDLWSGVTGFCFNITLYADEDELDALEAQIEALENAAFEENESFEHDAILSALVQFRQHSRIL